MLKRKRQFLRENFQLIKNVKIFGTKSFFRNYNSYPSISFLSFIISNRIEIWQRKDFNFQIQTSSTFFPKLRLFLFWLAAIAKLSFVFLASMYLNKPKFFLKQPKFRTKICLNLIFSFHFSLQNMFNESSVLILYILHTNDFLPNSNRATNHFSNFSGNSVVQISMKTNNKQIKFVILFLLWLVTALSSKVFLLLWFGGW